jgi:adenine C2-methylase RlmN of 23S rRNA A2503 and tRNA A37
MELKNVQAVLARLKEPGYRLKQIKKGVYRDAAACYAEIQTLPAGLRAALEREAPILSFEPKELLASGSGDAQKALLCLRDGLHIETVLLKAGRGGNWTACLSSQAGCAFGCVFCATGRLGLERNLTSEEISDQLLFWRQVLKKAKDPGALDHVVYMGMGEPLHNYEAVAASLHALTAPDLFGMGDRHIAVSTIGVPGGIARLSDEFPQVNLAVSLHAATDSLRDRLAPANRAYPLGRLAEALKSAISRNRRKVFLEVVLLSGVNDRPEDAKALVRFVRATDCEYLIHVNLIPFNSAGADFEPSTEEAVRLFQDTLRACGVSVTLRRSLGADIRGACGQLAGKRGSRRAHR